MTEAILFYLCAAVVLCAGVPALVHILDVIALVHRCRRARAMRRP